MSDAPRRRADSRATRPALLRQPSWPVHIPNTRQQRPSPGADVVIATCYYGKTAADIARLREWCARAQRYVGVFRVLVAVRGDVDETISNNEYIGDETVRGVHVTILDVRPWHGVSDALNALLYEARQAGARCILYMSCELVVSASDVARVVSVVDANTLVAGARLPGHDYAVGGHEAAWRRAPWNTFACWRVDALVTGFSIVADGAGEWVRIACAALVCDTYLEMHSRTRGWKRS